ncbi:MAG: DUF218 domain-containing protein [Leptolyngbyaceae cyanobacterium RU_5_1]|nr:DUF218 domain-containing protein [Leptolyngbyaceae cyanobacterium RU_5_1]
MSDASWLAFKAKLFGVIKLPMPWSIKLLFGLFIILMVITYPWIIRQPGLKRWLQQSTWQRSLIQISISVLLMGLLLLSPPGAALANQALVGFLPVDSGEPVDAIVILGRGQRFQQSRVDVASDLWWGDRAPVIFASGTGDAPAMLELLRQKGIPDHVLAGENCSLTTEEKRSVFCSHAEAKRDSRYSAGNRSTSHVAIAAHLSKLWVQSDSPPQRTPTPNKLSPTSIAAAHRIQRTCYLCPTWTVSTQSILNY